MLTPNPKAPSLFSLNTKLRVKGTMQHPKVRPDTAALSMKGAKALSALGFGPLGLLSPFVSLGALAGHAAVSTLVSGGVSAASEKFSANVEADANRTAKDIAKRLEDFFFQQDWIPASAVK